MTGMRSTPPVLYAYPEDDPITAHLLEAHALLAGDRPVGVAASPGPREKAMTKIEFALRYRRAELRFDG